MTGAVGEGGPLSVQIEAQKICIHKASVDCSFDGLLSTREGKFLPTFSFGLQAFSDALVLCCSPLGLIAELPMSGGICSERAFSNKPARYLPFL